MTPQEKLEQHRGSIDNLDAALIHIMAERFRVTKAVGALKATNDF
ncbi:MAG: chorismate mutase, partial [Pseudomonadota bacterium]